MFTPTLLQSVSCPEDRGTPAHVGRVMGVGDTVHHNHQGVPYRWTTVHDDRGNKAIWPSNRLAAA